MSLRLPELDDLELDMILAGDQVSFVTSHGGLYSCVGDVLVERADQVTDETYRTAWRLVEAAANRPDNRRGNLFNRAGEDFLVVTQYLGLDMTTASLSPHVPQTWETQILTVEAVSHLWRYGSRAAAFAGHERVVEILGGLPDVTKIK